LQLILGMCAVCNCFF